MARSPRKLGIGRYEAGASRRAMSCQFDRFSNSVQGFYTSEGLWYPLAHAGHMQVILILASLLERALAPIDARNEGKFPDAQTVHTSERSRAAPSQEEPDASPQLVIAEPMPSQRDGRRAEGAEDVIPFPRQSSPRTTRRSTRTKSASSPALSSIGTSTPCRCADAPYLWRTVDRRKSQDAPFEFNISSDGDNEAATPAQVLLRTRVQDEQNRLQTRHAAAECIQSYVRRHLSRAADSELVAPHGAEPDAGVATRKNKSKASRKKQAAQKTADEEAALEQACRQAEIDKATNPAYDAANGVNVILERYEKNHSHFVTCPAGHRVVAIVGQPGCHCGICGARLQGTVALRCSAGNKCKALFTVCTAVEECGGRRWLNEYEADETLQRHGQHHDDETPAIQMLEPAHIETPEL